MTILSETITRTDSIQVFIPLFVYRKFLAMISIETDLIKDFTKTVNEVEEHFFIPGYVTYFKEIFRISDE